MARMPRKKSATGIYHVMLRGADRRILFSDDEDCEQFLDTLRRAKKESMIRLFAYCLMGNHVHLLLREGDEPLGNTFKRIGVSYAHYYNWKYQLHGHLFQDRYRSERVEDDAYFLDVVRYICQNPVKAGLSKEPFGYPWLGCGEIAKAGELLDGFGDLTDLKGDTLVRFIGERCDGEHLEDHGAGRLTDREAIGRLRKACGCGNVQDIGGWTGEKRETAVRKALGTGVSIRQLSRLTGVSKAVIERITKKQREERDGTVSLRRE